ncbi:uncharacterized protein [Ptychodera flava]|uniref:uncharacterized protein n=1 Tax=Ptychodera flava TaxID=63121 RepID=UPI00396A4C04
MPRKKNWRSEAMKKNRLSMGGTMPTSGRVLNASAALKHIPRDIQTLENIVPRDTQMNQNDVPRDLQMNGIDVPRDTQMNQNDVPRDLQMNGIDVPRETQMSQNDVPRDLQMNGIDVPRDTKMNLDDVPWDTNMNCNDVLQDTPMNHNDVPRDMPIKNNDTNNKLELEISFKNANRKKLADKIATTAVDPLKTDDIKISQDSRKRKHSDEIANVESNIRKVSDDIGSVTVDSNVIGKTFIKDLNIVSTNSDDGKEMYCIANSSPVNFEGIEYVHCGDITEYDYDVLCNEDRLPHKASRDKVLHLLF